jgi:hypothetical protein
MRTESPKAKDPLKPEVMAVIRTSFDGYNEPEPRPASSKQAPAKSAATHAG